MERTDLTFRAGVTGLVPDAWIVRPPGGDTAPPVVAVHGVTRGVEEMVALLAPQTRERGRTLVVPHFSTTDWPRYQRAACKARADLALLRLMAALSAEARVMPGRFDLSGFSGGAQFAHRFTWLYPQAVGRLCAIAPGWWTFPDTAVAWPYGMAAAPGRDAAQGFRLASNLRGFLDRRIVVGVGSDDVNRDTSVRQSPEIDAQQGHTRVARAHRWVDMARAQARAAGLTPRISLRMLQGCGHSFADCVTRAGLGRVFVPAARTCAAPCAARACQATCFTPLIHERTAA